LIISGMSIESEENPCSDGAFKPKLDITRP